MRLLAACTLVAACTQTVPTRLYSGERRPRGEVATIRADGVHRLTEVDGEAVQGQLFAIEPGRHRLEFFSRSKGSVYGFGIPRFETRCRVELEMEPGHFYEFEGEIESSTPDPSRYEGFTWRLYSLDGQLVDKTTGKAAEGLACAYPCRAVGRFGSTYKWMPCSRYREVVRSPEADDPVN